MRAASAHAWRTSSAQRTAACRCTCRASGSSWRRWRREDADARSDRPGGGGRMSRPTRARSRPGGSDVLRVLGSDVVALRERKPPWLKVLAPGGPRCRELPGLIADERLHTVCQEAACPNVGECWERGTATFMILGDTCTRRCGFCNVKTGTPTWNDPLEPARVARSIARMGLRHAVVTSVDRDDLPDKGASAFVGVIRQVRRQAPGCKIEVLTPDFQGQEMPLAKVIAERPDVFNHNVEVVPRLYPLARRGSRFARSCRVLRLAGELDIGGHVAAFTSEGSVGVRTRRFHHPFGCAGGPRDGQCDAGSFFRDAFCADFTAAADGNCAGSAFCRHFHFLTDGT